MPEGRNRGTGPFEELAALLTGSGRDPSEAVTEDHVLSILAAVRARSDLFGSRLFSDPAWEIVLELYAADLAKRTATIGDLLKLVAAPSSTILRWLSALVEEGVISIEDRSAEENAVVYLNPDAVSKMSRLTGRWIVAFYSI